MRGSKSQIYGGAGTNYLYAGAGLDDLYGGSGTNYLYGGGLNDLLVGGTGANAKNCIVPGLSQTNSASVVEHKGDRRIY